MKPRSRGETAITPSFVQHFDACLGCMACVTACPSGVQYDPLVERPARRSSATPPLVRRPRVPRGAVQRCPYPRRLRVVLAPLGSRPGGEGAAAGRGSSRGCRARLRRAGVAAPRVSWASLRAALPSTPPAGGRAAGEGRSADRLRAAASFFRRRQRRDDQRAGRRRVRGDRTGRSRVLRRAGAPRRTRRRGARLRAAADRHVRQSRRRSDHRQRRRLRVVDEGVRRAARATIPRGPPAPTRSPRGCATSREVLVEIGEPRARAAPGPTPGSSTTMPAIWRTRRASGRSRAICCARFRASRSSTSGRAGHLLRQRRHLQPGRAGRGRASSARARREHRRAAAGRGRHRKPRLPDADRQAPECRRRPCRRRPRQRALDR